MLRQSPQRGPSPQAKAIRNTTQIIRPCPRYSALLFALIVVYGLSLVYLLSQNRKMQKTVRRLQQDGTGLYDFAWRFNGARIVDDLTTPATKGSGSGIKTNPPFIAIDDDNRPGRCWPFNGFVGQLGVLFPIGVNITAISVDHLPQELALSVSNAPRNIKIWGFTEVVYPREGPSIRDAPSISHPDFAFKPVAEFQYDAFGPTHIQTFPVFPVGGPFDGIVAEILDNWGGGSTCLYRIRVHGQAQSDY